MAKRKKPSASASSNVTSGRSLKSYIAWLDYDDELEAEVGWHGQVCCLIRADSPDRCIDELRKLMERLREHECGALEGVKELHHMNFVELPEPPGNAVLLSQSWRPVPHRGMAQVMGSLLIDDSGGAAAYGWGDEEMEAGDSIEPFMTFDDERANRSRGPRRGRREG